jgi:uncharacterized protein (DUF433 family)
MPLSKLTRDQVEVIITSHKSGMSIKRLSSVYNVTYEQIRRIVREERWVKKPSISIMNAPESR